MGSLQIAALFNHDKERLLVDFLRLLTLIVSNVDQNNRTKPKRLRAELHLNC